MWLESRIHTVHPLLSRGVGGGADMSPTGFHPLWDKIPQKTYRPSPTKDVTQKDPSIIRGPLIGGRLYGEIPSHIAGLDLTVSFHAVIQLTVLKSDFLRIRANPPL
jgi:hypothetical protein